MPIMGIEPLSPKNKQSPCADHGNRTADLNKTKEKISAWEKIDIFREKKYLPWDIAKVKKAKRNMQI